MVWDPRFKSRLFCGCENGKTLLIDRFQDPDHEVLTGTVAPVYALDIDTVTGYLAISIGSEVHVAQEILGNTFAMFVILPKPADFPDMLPDSRVHLRSVHFLKNGTRLIVSYLNHGIICWDLKTHDVLWHIVPPLSRRQIMNLYVLGEKEPLQSFLQPTNTGINIPLGTGSVKIWDTLSGEHLQMLEHQDVIMQQVSTYQGSSVGMGEKTQIVLWRATGDIQLDQILGDSWWEDVRNYMWNILAWDFDREMQCQMKLDILSILVLVCFLLCFSQINVMRTHVERYIFKILELCYDRASQASKILAPTLKFIWYWIKSAFWSLVSSGISWAVMTLTWLGENLGVEDLVGRQEL
ncbi:uncharacterized protein F5147DRAFT_654626 [Suillus discolor]|uniref:Uncharacterized protein n=1 Tax=Suillus discolor TaxID=1912936 RepID=A0A9P7JS01_9AGAM|nr:uncharacterized protein F5147DRAFT_654626 [Suillus discolor]KAG2103710.1 hypothetical protein F5147DRAFT_654626 [Suillus discolor]